MKTGILRIALGAGLAFVAAFGISLANGLDGPTALGNGLIFALTVSVIVALLSWAAAIAQRKGYSPWVGLLVLLVFNVFGIFLLLWLPAKSQGKP